MKGYTLLTKTLSIFSHSTAIEVIVCCTSTQHAKKIPVHTSKQPAQPVKLNTQTTMQTECLQEFTENGHLNHLKRPDILWRFQNGDSW